VCLLSMARSGFSQSRVSAVQRGSPGHRFGVVKLRPNCAVGRAHRASFAASPPANRPSVSPRRIRRRLVRALRRGAKQLLDASEKQRVMAMVCSAPPKGQARWTVRLIAEEAVKRKLVPRVGRETIRVLFSTHDLKPWGKNVVRGRSE
jgi:hypothetical protein